MNWRWHHDPISPSSWLGRRKEERCITGSGDEQLSVDADDEVVERLRAGGEPDADDLVQRMFAALRDEAREGEEPD